MKRVALMLSFCSALAACGGGDGSSDRVFIALQQDFADYASWQKFYFGHEPLEGHPTGPRYGFVKQTLRPGELKYPIGDIIVKVIEVSAEPSSWDLFAMAKRGGNFNPTGAKNWEFFSLSLATSGVPVIVARGIDASDPANSLGHGYAGATGNFIRCNGCHGDPTMAKNDYILNPELQPGYTGPFDGPLGPEDGFSWAVFDGGTD